MTTRYHTWWMDIRPALRFSDWIIFAISVIAFAFVSLLAFQGTGAGGEAVVQAENGSFVYTLNQDRIIDLHGPLGTSIIEIKEGQARFIDSPCKDKLCVHSGWQSLNGQWAACLPNRVFLRISSLSAPEVDAQAY